MADLGGIGSPLVPANAGGRPCVRGQAHPRVSDVLDLLANGLSPEQIVDELLDLEPADIQACLRALVARRQPPSDRGVHFPP